MALSAKVMNKAKSDIVAIAGTLGAAVDESDITFDSDGFAVIDGMRAHRAIMAWRANDHTGRTMRQIMADAGI